MTREWTNRRDGTAIKENLGFEVLTAVVMKSSVFWDIMPCSLLKVNQHFGGTCRYFPLKRQLTFHGLQGVISQKIEVLIREKLGLEMKI
jgi:hypothetical protein